MSSLEIESRKTGDNGWVLDLRGELDLSTSAQLGRCLEEVPGEVRELVVDLSALSFLDSSGLAVLLRTHKRAIERGRRLFLVAGPENVHGVFEITKLDSYFEFVPAAS